MPGKARGDGKPFKRGDKRAGRPKGRKNEATLAVEEACKGIVENPDYRRNLRERADTGALAPAVETMIWHYAYGKPKERVELTGEDGGPVKTEQVTRAEALAALNAVMPKSLQEADPPPGEPIEE